MILFADDLPGNNIHFIRALEAVSNSVVVIRTVNGALETIRASLENNESIDALVLDVDFPEEEPDAELAPYWEELGKPKNAYSLALAGWLNHRHKEIPFLFLTAVPGIVPRKKFNNRIIDRLYAKSRDVAKAVQQLVDEHFCPEFQRKTVKIEKVSIRNIKCFNSIVIDFDSDSNIDLIIGVNARGKTTILQLISLALCNIKSMPFPYSWKKVVKTDCEVGTFELGILLDGQSVNFKFEIDQNDSITCVAGATELQSIQDKFLLFAYGANRYVKLEDPRPNKQVEGIATLFGENGYLKHIKASENFALVRASDNFDKIKALINQVLEKTDDKLIMQLSNYDSNSMYFNTRLKPEQEIPIEGLSEGYKSTIVWLFDMMLRIVEKGGDLGNAHIMTGIILLDEVDLHLHPRWQQTILPSVRAVFPNMQFIVSSHSLFVAQSITDESVISLEWENDQVVVQKKDMSSERSFSAIARELFNVQSPFSHSTAQKLMRFREIQKAIRLNQDFKEEEFKDLVIEIAEKGVELEGVMRREIRSLELRTGKDFELWKK